jgi:hypothetical protein
MDQQAPEVVEQEQEQQPEQYQMAPSQQVLLIALTVRPRPSSP